MLAWVLAIVRLAKEAKLVVGRNETENGFLERAAQKDDYLFIPTDAKGPAAVGRGVLNPELIERACRVMARYCDRARDDRVAIKYQTRSGEAESARVGALDEDELNKLRI